MRAFNPLLTRRLAMLLVCLYAAGANARPVPAPLQVQLDVVINGYRTNLLGSFTVLTNGRILSTRKELDEIGIVVPAQINESEIHLDQIEGLKYTYDAEHQAILIVAETVRLKPQFLGARPEGATAYPAPAKPLVGAVINYGLSTSIYDQLNSTQPIRSLSVDSRAFSPLGTINLSGFAGTGASNTDPFVRLETAWSLVDIAALRTWRIGDLVTRGPAWSRSIRLGGAQLQSDYGLRSDLITSATPSFKGSAAVPSTVDVFIDNTKVYSEEVRPGPFVINNLPTVAGSGSARIVVRDAAGRETVQSTNFYNSPILLRTGIFDYSVETGAVRRNFGIDSSDYDDRLVGSGSVRYGVVDTMTLEGHGEAGTGLLNLGGGASFNLFDRSVWSLAASGSSWGRAFGAQGYLAVDTKLGPATLHLSAQHTLGSFRDLASVVHPRQAPAIGGVWGHNLTTYLPPSALDLATLSFPLSDHQGSISLSFINRKTDELSSRIVAASYNRPLIANASMFVNGFHDLSSGNTGVYAGLSVSLGELGHAQLGYSRSRDGTTERSSLNADYARTASREPGSIGWRISEASGDSNARSASLTYQSSAARIEGGADQVAGHIRARANVDGALVVTDAGTFLANRVDDAFAVVDVGAPGVDVLLENQPVAITNADGRALIPGLRSHQRNKITIDPDKLPPDVTVPDVRSVAVPGDRGGIAVDLKAGRVTRAAVVVFRDAAGHYVPVGSKGHTLANRTAFVVGYDGRSYIDDLNAENIVTIDVPGKQCSASFRFEGKTGTQVVIDPVVCR